MQSLKENWSWIVLALALILIIHGIPNWSLILNIHPELKGLKILDTYGDFIGAIISAFVAYTILFYTLRAQKEASWFASNASRIPSVEAEQLELNDAARHIEFIIDRINSGMQFCEVRKGRARPTNISSYLAKVRQTKPRILAVGNMRGKARDRVSFFFNNLYVNEWDEITAGVLAPIFTQHSPLSDQVGMVEETLEDLATNIENLENTLIIVKERQAKNKVFLEKFEIDDI